MINILLAEDDSAIVSALTAFLGAEGFHVDNVPGQSGAIRALEEKKYELVLLDVSLADGNGFSLCGQIKASWNIPVIFLTASGDEFSTVTGLELGADDYIAKPFRPRELVSRIKAALRRYMSSPVLEVGDVRVDPDKASVTKGGVSVTLSALEYRLLLVFSNNQGAVLSRTRLLQEIWDLAGEFVNDNTLTVYIKRLRGKLEDDPQNPTLIKTVRGIGYKVGD